MKPETIDKAASYAYGISGITWGGFVALSGELTTVLGFFTALLGFVLVLLRLVRDMKGKRRGK